MSGLMNDLFSLIRWRNLIITSLALSISYFFLLVPISSRLGEAILLSPAGFILLLFSVLSIMAGGYVINDVVDTESDQINVKRSGFINRFGKKPAVFIYTGFSLTGLALGGVLSYAIKIHLLWNIHLVAVLLLLMYSVQLKSLPLVGNLTIAALCGILPLLPLIFAYASLTDQFRPAYFIFNFMSLFAFLLTLIREIIKDIEDVEGDRKTNALTLVVLFGLNATRWMASVFVVSFIIMMLITLYYFLGNDYISLTYIAVAVLIPAIALQIGIIRSASTNQYGKLSKMVKGLMMSGLFYAVVYYLIYL